VIPKWEKLNYTKSKYRTEGRPVFLRCDAIKIVLWKLLDFPTKDLCVYLCFIRVHFGLINVALKIKKHYFSFVTIFSVILILSLYLKIDKLSLERPHNFL